MCGASSAQNTISDAQIQMYQKLNDAYSTTFGQQQAITGALTSAFTPILNAGPSQTGFSPSQENAMRTQNTENVATNYAQSQTATANAIAAMGGGNIPQTSTVTANALAANANEAARARSVGENAITQQNYAQGYKNWGAATTALSNTASLINPVNYAGQSTGAGNAAASSAAAIAAANNSPWNAAIGALGSIGGAALGNWSSLMPKSASPIPGAAPYAQAPQLTSMIPMAPMPAYPSSGYAGAMGGL